MMKRALGVMLAGAVLLVGWPAHVAAIASQPQSALRGTSCVSASFCESVGVAPNNAGFYVTLAETWNGKSWTMQPTPNPAGAGYISLQGVSCVSATFCEAVGSAQHAGIAQALAEVWNGATWMLQSIPNAAGATLTYLNSVSCVTATYCEAVGEAGNNNTSVESTVAEVWNGTAWAIQPSPNSAVFGTTNVLSSVSCVSASFCEAVGAVSGATNTTIAATWDGTSWTLQPPATGGVEPLGGVSCVSASDCEAVGSGQAEMWNGTSWAMQPIPGAPSGVSCVSASYCEAVDGNAAVWDGTSWTVQPVPYAASMKSAQLFAVSCVSAVACEASGAGMHQGGRGLPLTEGWNGSVWTPQ